MKTMTEESYKEYEKGMKKLAKEVASTAGTKVAKRVAKQEERKNSKKCDMARMIFRESLDMYEDGDLSWEDMIEDLATTLKAVEEDSE